MDIAETSFWLSLSVLSHVSDCEGEGKSERWLECTGLWRLQTALSVLIVEAKRNPKRSELGSTR